MDEERTRVGADLHDGLCQELSGLSYMLSGLAKRARIEQSPLACDLDSLAGLASGIVVSAHDLAHGMLPMELRRADLSVALKALARTTFRVFKVRLTIRMVVSPRFQPKARVAENLYRIAQESVSNAIRHGHANRVSLSLLADSKRLRFTITDDGKGFADPKTDHGMGLKIMRYRMRMLGGTLKVEHLPQGGTRVIGTIALAGKRFDATKGK